MFWHLQSLPIRLALLFYLRKPNNSSFIINTLDFRNNPPRFYRHEPFLIQLYNLEPDFIVGLADILCGLLPFLEGLFLDSQPLGFFVLVEGLLDDLVAEGWWDLAFGFGLRCWWWGLGFFEGLVI